MTRLPWLGLAFCSVILSLDLGCGGSTRAAGSGDASAGNLGSGGSSQPQDSTTSMANAGEIGTRGFDAGAGSGGSVGPVSSGGAYASATGGAASGGAGAGGGGVRWDGGVEVAGSGGIDASAGDSGGQIGGRYDGAAGASGGAGQGGASVNKGGSIASSSSSAPSCPQSPPTPGASCVASQNYPCLYQDCTASGITVADCMSGKWQVKSGACMEFGCDAYHIGSDATCPAGTVCLANWGEDAKCVTHTCGTGPITPQCVPGAKPDTQGHCFNSGIVAPDYSSVGLRCCPWPGSAC
jgi:hypothetical protein